MMQQETGDLKESEYGNVDFGTPTDATGGAAIWKPGRTLLLSPGRQILMEEEVITPPRGGPSGP